MFVVEQESRRVPASTQGSNRAHDMDDSRSLALQSREGFPAVGVTQVRPLVPVLHRWPWPMHGLRAISRKSACHRASRALAHVVNLVLTRSRDRLRVPMVWIFCALILGGVALWSTSSGLSCGQSSPQCAVVQGDPQ